MAITFDYNFVLALATASSIEQYSSLINNATHHQLYNVTKACELVNSNIPTSTTNFSANINTAKRQLIDQSQKVRVTLLTAFIILFTNKLLLLLNENI